MKINIPSCIDRTNNHNFKLYLDDGIIECQRCLDRYRIVKIKNMKFNPNTLKKYIGLK